jgi:hypothetical protein
MGSKPLSKEIPQPDIKEWVSSAARSGQERRAGMDRRAGADRRLETDEPRASDK